MMTTRAETLQDNLMSKPKTSYEMVREFTKAMGQPLDEDISIEQQLSNNGYDNFLDLRYKLIQEEFDEFMSSDDYENMLKELMDIKYVIDGFCATFGWDAEIAFQRVHESNLSKLDSNGKPIYNEFGKVLKGPNYKEPYLGDLV